MDFYVIPPLSHLHLMNKGDRFFCLAQLYINNKEYRDFFHKKREEGAWITLDNGAGDHDLVTEEALINVALDLQPNEVIPPDVLFDGVKTIRNLESFIELMKEKRLLNKVKVFACPQGKNKEEWLFVYDYMLYHPHVDVIGFSKIAVPYAFLGAKNDTLIKESRHMVYDYLKAKGKIIKPIHCLGAGDPREFEYYKNDPLMRSTDSCFSVWSGMNKVVWEEENFIRIPTPKDYFTRDIDPECFPAIASNIEWLRGKLKNS